MKHLWISSGDLRETKSMCFSLNIPDDQLPGMAVAGMLPAIREELFGMEFDDLGQLSHRLSFDEQSSIWIQERLQICQAQ
jgi:hypothetical protein